MIYVTSLLLIYTWIASKFLLFTDKTAKNILYMSFSYICKNIYSNIAEVECVNQSKEYFDTFCKLLFIKKTSKVLKNSTLIY